MNYNLSQIISALSNLSVLAGEKDKAIDKVRQASASLSDALKELDGLQVVTRGCVETLLAAMLALEAIIGGAENG